MTPPRPYTPIGPTPIGPTPIGPGAPSLRASHVVATIKATFWYTTHNWSECSGTDKSREVLLKRLEILQTNRIEGVTFGNGRGLTQQVHIERYQVSIWSCIHYHNYRYNIGICIAMTIYTCMYINKIFSHMYNIQTRFIMRILPSLVWSVKGIDRTILVCRCWNHRQRTAMKVETCCYD